MKAKKNAPHVLSPRTTRWIHCSLAAFLLLAPASTIFGAGGHACDYLGKDEVARVMEAAVGNVERHEANPMGQSICFFDIPVKHMGFAQLQMFRTSWAMRSGELFTAPGMFANNMSFLDNLEEIDTIGEKAYWGGTGLKLGAGLHVLQGDAYFNVMVSGGDAGQSLEKARELALLVLTTL